MNGPRFQDRRARRGFTLIELLVASGVTVLLVGFIVAIVANVSGYWNRSSGRLTVSAQARYVLDQLTLDLQSAHYRDDGNVWLAASIPANTGTSTFWNTANNINPKPTNTVANGSLQALATGNLGDNSPTSPRFGQTGVWLRFFTTKRGANTAATPTTISAPVAVGWQIIRRPTNGVAGNLTIRYFLHRAEARPGTNGTRPGTLDSGYSITAAAYTTSTAGTNNGATTGDPRGTQVPGSLTNTDAIIGENVIDFGVRCYVRGTTGSALTPVFPTSATTLSYLATTPPRIGAVTSQFPEVVDVMVRILTDEGAAQLTAFEAGRLTAPAGRTTVQYWWDIALANSQVFTRRITLRVQPL